MVNTTAAIMAIPGPMDPIRLVGDEEKHATLLFFGETSSLPGEAKQTLLDAVELASTMLFPFGEAIVDVTRLGSDIPPALVALLAGENLNQVRNLFLMNPAVNDYRGNTDQFPGFTPHVTLSHPDFTDEAIQRALMRQVYRVQFDWLSVWWNDERFDFPLGPAQDNTSMADVVDRFAAQYALEDSDNLAHHGVKGQKWGVRKTGPGDHSVFKVTADATPKVGKTFEHGGQTHTVVRAVTRADGKHIVTTRPTATIAKERKAELGAKLVKIVKKDKEYWQKSAAIAGVALTGLAAAAVAPALLPASAILAAGGPAVLSSNIALSTAIATRGAYAHNYIQYIRRAKTPVVRHAALGNKATVGEVYDNLTPTQKTAADLLIAAYSKGEEVDGDTEIQTGWASMTPMERSVVLFLASGTAPDNVAHSAVDGVLASIVEIKEDDAEQHGVKGQKWGVRKADAIGVSSLASGGMTVTTMPSKSTAQGGKEPGIKSSDNVAVATHNIAKNLSDGPNTEKVWAGIHNEIVAKTGNGNSLTAKNMPVVNEIVAKHLTKAANEMTAAGTSSRVMVSHTLNKKLSPQGIPMIHLIVGKKQSDVDAYVDLTKSSLNGGKSALDPNKDWIVHSADAPKVEVVSLKPVLDKGGFIVGIKAPTIMHVDQQVDDILKSIVEAGDDDTQQHGIKGMKWGVRRAVDSATGRVEMTGSTGLNPRRGSADQIAQDRIQKKIDTVGVHALSTAELQSYSRRLQMEKDVNRVLAEQSAAQKAASQSFITNFVKKQAARQTNRVVDKALDVAVEKALHEAGIKIGKKGGNPDAADLLVKTAHRLAPKKGK